jgi:hypothetical protein
MKPILFSLIILAACTKGELSTHEPNNAYLISDKFTADTILIKIDTLWKGYNLTREEIGRIKSIGEKWYSWLNCPAPVPSLPAFRLERHRYIIY